MSNVRYLVSTLVMAALLFGGVFAITPVSAKDDKPEDVKVNLCVLNKDGVDWKAEAVKEKDVEKKLSEGAFYYFGPVKDDGKIDNKDKQADEWCEKNVPIETKAEAVTFTAPTCDEKGTYTIPTVDGVTYSVDSVVVAAGTYTADDGSTVTVVAEATPPYFLADESDSEWSYTFTAAEDCDGEVLGTTTTTQVTSTPTGAANTGAGSTAVLAGFIGSVVLLSAGAVTRKFWV